MADTAFSTPPELGWFQRTAPHHSVNEDSFGRPDEVDPVLLARGGYLYLLADGMGGHQAGHRASYVAVNSVMQAYYTHPSPDHGVALVAAIQAANAEIHGQSNTTDTAGMGSTVVAALLADGLLQVAHVGDSRAYLVRGGQVEPLTQDHSWLGEILKDESLTPAEIEAHPYRHVLTRALGPDAEVRPDLSALWPLQAGDRVVLTSDGVTDVVSAADIGAAVSGATAQTGAERLGALAVERGTTDDVTVMVLDPFVGQSAVVTAQERAPRSLLGALLGSVLLSFLALGGGCLLVTQTGLLTSVVPMVGLARTGTATPTRPAPASTAPAGSPASPTRAPATATVAPAVATTARPATQTTAPPRPTTPAATATTGVTRAATTTTTATRPATLTVTAPPQPTAQSTVTATAPPTPTAQATASPPPPSTATATPRPSATATLSVAAISTLDLNRDRRLTCADDVWLRGVMARVNPTRPARPEWRRYDLNGDGFVNAADRDYLLQRLGLTCR